MVDFFCVLFGVDREEIVSDACKICELWRDGDSLKEI